MPCAVCGKDVKLDEGEILHYKSAMGYGKVVERLCADCMEWVRDHVHYSGRINEEPQCESGRQDPWHRTIMERFRTSI